MAVYANGAQMHQIYANGNRMNTVSANGVLNYIHSTGVRDDQSGIQSFSFNTNDYYATYTRNNDQAMGFYFDIPSTVTLTSIKVELTNGFHQLALVYDGNLLKDMDTNKYVSEWSGNLAGGKTARVDWNVIGWGGINNSVKITINGVPAVLSL